MLPQTLPKTSALILFFLLVVVVEAFSQAGTEFGTVGELSASRCWAYELAAGRSFTMEAGTVFVATSDSRVEAVSANGRKFWTTELGGGPASNIVAGDAGLVIVTNAPAKTDSSPSSMLRVLSKDTGITVSTVKLPDSGSHFVALSGPSLIVVSGSGVIQSIDARSGNIKWRREVASGFIGRPVLSADNIVLTSSAKQLFVIALASGEIESMRKLDSLVTAFAQTESGDLVFGDDRGSITYLLDGQVAQYWKFKTGGSITSLRTTGDNSLLAASNDNFVYSLRSRSGGLNWKRRLAGRVTQMGFVNKDLALISSIDEYGATFVNLLNGRTVGQVALDENEAIVDEPIGTDGSFFLLTNKRLYSYGLKGCTTVPK